MLAKLAIGTMALGVGLAGLAVARPLLLATADCGQNANTRRTGNHQHWSPYNPKPCNTTVCDPGQGTCVRLAAFVADPGDPSGRTGTAYSWCRCTSEPPDPSMLPLRCILLLSAKAAVGQPVGPWTGVCVEVVNCPEEMPDCLEQPQDLDPDEPGVGWQVITCACQ